MGQNIQSDSNWWPHDSEYPPFTTRPGLPDHLLLVLGLVTVKGCILEAWMLMAEVRSWSIFDPKQRPSFGMYHWGADLLFYWFGFKQTQTRKSVPNFNVKKHLNPNQYNSLTDIGTSPYKASEYSLCMMLAKVGSFNIGNSLKAI